MIDRVSHRDGAGPAIGQHLFMFVLVSFLSSACAVAINAGPPTMPCAVQFEPKAIDIDYPAVWVVATIHPMEWSEFDVRTVDVSTVRLAGSIPADVEYGVVVNPGPDETLSVRFSGPTIRPVLRPGMNRLELSGRLAGGGAFKGASRLKVMHQSRKIHVRLLSRAGSAPVHFAAESPDPGRHEISVYDARGRLVRRWKARPSAMGHLTWEGQLNDGARAPSGVYFIQVVSGTTRGTIKAVIVR